MKWRGPLGLVLLAVICQPALPVRADGLIRDGIGPISTGRGGTNQGFADNAAIILDNPGAMVNVAGSGLAEFGADTVISDVRYTNPLNDSTSKIRPLPMPVLGYVKKSDDDRWAFGMGAFAPAGFGSSYGVMNQALLGPNLYKSLGGMGKILPGLSYRVTDRLSVGMTVGLAFSYAELNGPYFLQRAVPPVLPAGVPAVIDVHGFGVAPCGSVGFQYQLASDTMLGLCYTEQSNFDLRGDAAATVFAGGPLPSTFDSKIRIKWPRSVAFGFKHDLCPHQRIAADVIWYDWAHAFDQLNLQLSNPSNPIIAALAPTIKDVLPLHWQDSVALRLGYEFQPDDLNTYRAGYVYHGSPAPGATLNPYLDGILTNSFSLGYSRKMNRVILNTAYQYNFGPTRHVGTSSLVGGDFNNSSLNVQAHFAMISLLIPF
jgi:long-chain fatty acid transport protein